MKKLIYLPLLVLFVACQAQAQPGPSVLGEPNISVDQEVYDFGVIQKGADGQCTFTITNTGSDPLIISKCDKTCGCTVPKCSKEPIVSGGTSEVLVTYDTNRVGPFNKAVKVHTNDPDEPLKMLRIKGEVVASAD